MTPEQIKQTVAEIRERQVNRKNISCIVESDFTDTREDCDTVIRITDHLQKTIEEQAAEISEARKLAEHGRDIAWAYHKEYEPESGLLQTPLPWEKKT